MKKLIILITILMTITCFAESKIIDTTGGKALGALGLNPNSSTSKLDTNLQYDSNVTYPRLVKKNSDYFCYTGENNQFQLYGWQQVDTLGAGDIEWRYFDTDTGKMVRNQWTEDGYYIGDDGRVIPEAGNARDYSTQGFKFGMNSKELMYNFGNGTSAVGDWFPISPLNNGVYYWYYFNYNGILETNKTDVMGKYKVNKEGQYMKDNEVVCFEIFKGKEADLTTKPTYDKDNVNNTYEIVYNKEGTGILNVTPIDGSVIYSVGNSSKQATFLNQVVKDDASNCDFDLEDRNFYDAYAEDKKGVMRRAILMKGTKASMKIRCNKYNTYKIKYAIEYEGREPGSDSNAIAILDAYVNGDLINNDDEIYTSDPLYQVQEMELISDKNQPITLTFTSSNSSINLILTVDTMKNDKTLSEE